MCCSFPRKLYRLSGCVCVQIHQSNMCLSHVYMDLCCECYYSCLYFVLVNYLLNAFAICVDEVTVFCLQIIVLLL